MDIYQALMVSHQTQRELTARLLASEPAGPERAAIFLDLQRELLAHETAEERCLYVPLFDHDETVDASRHAIAEHHEMDEMVEALEALEPRSAGWMAGARKLCEKVLHHLEEEETRFFPQAREVLGAAQAESLARDYEAEFLTQRTKDI